MGLSKGKQITLAIVLTFLANIIFLFLAIIRTVYLYDECEYQKDLDHHQFISGVILLAGFVVQIAIVFVLFLRAAYKVPYVLSFVIYIGFFILFSKSMYSDFNYIPREFSKDDWFDRNTFFRLPLAKGIIDRKDLAGKCEWEIEAYLGAPYQKNENFGVYDIGWGTMRINMENGCFISAQMECPN